MVAVVPVADPDRVHREVFGLTEQRLLTVDQRLFQTGRPAIVVVFVDLDQQLASQTGDVVVGAEGAAVDALLELYRVHLCNYLEVSIVTPVLVNVCPAKSCR